MSRFGFASAGLVFQLVAIGLLLPAASISAQTFPLRPIRVVLGYPTGSTPDTLMRALGEGMAEDFRHPLVIDNRPGAGGIVAAETVARAPADGYTALVDGCSAAGMVYAFVLAGRAPFDPFKD